MFLALAVLLDFGPFMAHIWPMKTLTVSQLKAELGRTSDEVIDGKPCVVIRGNKFALIQRFDLPDASPAVGPGGSARGRLATSSQERFAVLDLAGQFPPETPDSRPKCRDI